MVHAREKKTLQKPSCSQDICNTGVSAGAGFPSHQYDRMGLQSSQDASLGAILLSISQLCPLLNLLLLSEKGVWCSCNMISGRGLL